MATHFRLVHQKTHKCDECPSAFNTILLLEKHKEIHKSDFFFECEVCHLKYKYKGSWRRHRIRAHSEEKPKFMCDYCSKLFQLKSDLAAHIERKHSGNEYICSLCGKKVKDSKHEWRHYRSSGKFPCDVCHAKFHSKFNLENHLLSHKIGFKCKLCGEVFVTSRELDYHRSKKHKPGYNCAICNKIFSSKPNFNQHVLTHAGIRPYKCDVCGEDYTQRSSMLRHRKSHPDPLPKYNAPVSTAGIVRQILDNFSKREKETG